MNQTIEDLKTRRSIRKFKDEQISDEELKTILEEDKKLEVVCNFCSERYMFNEEEIKKIIEE